MSVQRNSTADITFSLLLAAERGIADMETKLSLKTIFTPMGYVTKVTRAIATVWDADVIKTSRVKPNKKIERPKGIGKAVRFGFDDVSGVTFIQKLQYKVLTVGFRFKHHCFEMIPVKIQWEQGVRVTLRFNTVFIV